MYEQLAIHDIQKAADVLKSVYVDSKRYDGYVSLEVSPGLAHKTTETIEEARRLWNAVGRENLMIKVPGTVEGIPAFQQLIGEGINVNVTLLFAQDVYEEVAAAYIVGLETFAKGGGDVSRIASVASFFVSRIDTLVESKISALLKDATLPIDQQTRLQSLMGKVAIANAKLAYQSYKQIFRATMAGARLARRTDAARFVGQHQHKESRISRCALRRRIDRAKHREHDSPGDS